MQRLHNDITIEEIGQLVKSLTEDEMDEMINHWIDDETKEKLKKHLK